jgi:hypothetical protein
MPDNIDIRNRHDSKIFGENVTYSKEDGRLLVLRFIYQLHGVLPKVHKPAYALLRAVT